MSVLRGPIEFTIHNRSGILAILCCAAKTAAYACRDATTLKRGSSHRRGP